MGSAAVLAGEAGTVSCVVSAAAVVAGLDSVFDDVSAPPQADSATADIARLKAKKINLFFMITLFSLKSNPIIPYNFLNIIPF